MRERKRQRIETRSVPAGVVRPPMAAPGSDGRYFTVGRAGPDPVADDAGRDLPVGAWKPRPSPSLPASAADRSPLPAIGR